MGKRDKDSADHGNGFRDGYRGNPADPNRTTAPGYRSGFDRGARAKASEEHFVAKYSKDNGKNR